MLQTRNHLKRRIGFVDRIFRSAVLRQLTTLKRGEMTVADSQGVNEFGEPDTDLRASVFVADPQFYRRVVFGGGLGAAESLMSGEWRCDDLTALLRIFVRNMHVADDMDTGFSRLRRWMARFGHWLRRNTPHGSKRNIHEHYDLGNEFYSLFLDETLNYSCGVFESPDSTMLDASIAKMERVCRKLELRPSDHLVELGTGWGALAIYAAKNFGCRVTTTTISDEQYKLARRRVESEGLAGRVEVLRKDYRRLDGQFDKLVSIEMIEAVGHEYYGAFFRKCSDLLKTDGMMLLQSIVIADERYRQYLRTVDFIRRYIFSGGSLPSISVLTQVAAYAGETRMLQLEDFAPHYAETLRHWRRGFLNRIDEVHSLGFDERFIRMWTYYLCYCEAAFEERQVNLVQMLFAKRGCRVDPSRLDGAAPSHGTIDSARDDGGTFSGSTVPEHLTLESIR